MNRCIPYNKIFFYKYLKVSRFIKRLAFRKPDPFLFLAIICPTFHYKTDIGKETFHYNIDLDFQLYVYTGSQSPLLKHDLGDVA